MGRSVTRLTSGPQSHLTRLRAGYLAGGIPISALEKRAGEAGNRQGCDLGVRLTN